MFQISGNCQYCVVFFTVAGSQVKMRHLQVTPSVRFCRDRPPGKPGNWKLDFLIFCRGKLPYEAGIWKQCPKKNGYSSTEFWFNKFGAKKTKRSYVVSVSVVWFVWQAHKKQNWLQNKTMLGQSTGFRYPGIYRVLGLRRSPLKP